MRIALLSAVRNIDDDTSNLVAHSSFAGSTVLKRQIVLAKSLGCERIVCLVNDNSSEIGAAQSYCKRLGLAFQTCKDAPDLMPKIKHTDQLLVLADGLVISSRFATSLPMADNAVLAVPADALQNQNLERIDPTRRWAGIMLIPGEMLARLSDMPTDFDIVSVLLRTALQDGHPITTLSDEKMQALQVAGTASGITTAFETQEALALARPASFATPFRAIAHRIALATMQKNPHFGEFYDGRSHWLVVALIALGVVAIYFTLTVAAFTTIGIAAFIIYMGETVKRVSGLEEASPDRSRQSFTPILLIDVLAILAIATAGR